MPSKQVSHSPLASHFDIAIIRTLFSPSWSIDGYCWCLQYLIKRLTALADRNLLISPRKSSSLSHLFPPPSIAHLDLATHHHHLHLLDRSSLLFKPFIQSNLSRVKTLSQSDSNIHYKHLELLPESAGATGYIHSDGRMNFNVILAGIHAIVCKEYHLKIYELVLNLLDLLCHFNVLSSNDQNEQFDRMENEKFQLAIDIILRYDGIETCERISILFFKNIEKIRLSTLSSPYTEFTG